MRPVKPPFIVVVMPVNGLVIGIWPSGIWPSGVIDPAGVINPELVTDTGIVPRLVARVVPEVKPLGIAKPDRPVTVPRPVVPRPVSPASDPRPDRPVRLASDPRPDRPVVPEPIRPMSIPRPVFRSVVITPKPGVVVLVIKNLGLLPPPPADVTVVPPANPATSEAKLAWAMGDANTRNAPRPTVGCAPVRVAVFGDVRLRRAVFGAVPLMCAVFGAVPLMSAVFGKLTPFPNVAKRSEAGGSPPATETAPLACAARAWAVAAWWWWRKACALWPAFSA